MNGDAKMELRLLSELAQKQELMQRMLEAMLRPEPLETETSMRDLVEALVLNQQTIIEDNHIIKANSDALVRLFEDLKTSL